MKGRLRLGRQRTQAGIVLIVAIIVLLAMTLAAYALLRSVGSSLGIAGNLAFRQNATSAADVGVDAAVAWLSSSVIAAAPQTLEADVPAQAYNATWDASFNPLTFNWDAANSSVDVPFPAGMESGGNSVRYVIHRMCSKVGSTSIAQQECVSYRGSCANNSGGAGGPALSACPTQPYFRVTVRVVGPRNTISYVQVMAF
jgi:Tfp pilus assembly protein PilX